MKLSQKWRNWLEAAITYLWLNDSSLKNKPCFIRNSMALLVITSWSPLHSPNLTHSPNPDLHHVPEESLLCFSSSSLDFSSIPGTPNVHLQAAASTFYAVCLVALEPSSRWFCVYLIITLTAFNYWCSLCFLIRSSLVAKIMFTFSSSSVLHKCLDYGQRKEWVDEWLDWGMKTCSEKHCSQVHVISTIFYPLFS